MDEHQWIETKKECEVDGHGRLIPRMITLERSRKKYLGFDKKDAVDILLRIASFFAVFIPLGLFYLQRKAEINKQKAIYQLGVYAEVTSLLHQMLKMPADSTYFSSISNKLYFDSYPKVRILGETEVSNKFREIKNQLPLYAFLYKLDDSFNGYAQRASGLMDLMLYIDDTRTGDDKKTSEHYFAEKAAADSGYAAFLALQGSLAENFISREQSDTNGRGAILLFAKQEQEEAGKLAEQLQWFKNISERFYSDTVLNSRGYPDDYSYSYAGFEESTSTVNVKLKEMKQASAGQKDLIRRFKTHLLREVEELDSLMMVSNSHL